MLYPAIVAAALYVAYRVFSPPSATKYPPGPKADPFIGHVRIMPLEYAWVTFAKWAKQYGDLIYVHVLGRPIVIMSTVDMARELLDKRGANYSDRPRMVLWQEMMGWGAGLVFLRYGDRFRKQRRLMQQYFNSQAVLDFRPLQRNEVHTLLTNLLATPKDFAHHFHREISGTMTMVTYGHQVQGAHDPLVALVEKATTMTVSSGSAGATPVDFFPFLRHIPSWMPGAGFKRHAIAARAVIREMFDRPYEMVRKQRLAGTARQSLVSSLLEDYERMNTSDPEHEEDIKGVSGVIYGAGVETTLATIMTFVLAMVLNPQAAKRAQAEIDAAVGPDRLPDLDDRESLPYIDCIMKETLRWNPAVPLGIPHRSMKDDDFNGTHIPAGSMMIPNMYAMMRNERVYADPEAYNPDRFVAPHAEDYDPRSVIFGFGRRICPGRFFADASLWLTISNVLAVFDILPVLDARGQPVLPEAKFVSGTSSQPVPYECRFIPRNDKAAELAREAADHIE